MSDQVSAFNVKLRSLPSRLLNRGPRDAPLLAVISTPRDPRAWIVLARARFHSLPLRTQNLMEHHDLTPDLYAVVTFREYIERQCGAKLEALAGSSLRRAFLLSPKPAAIAEAIDEIVRWVTVAHCTHAFQVGPYYVDAEPYMPIQWEQVIWPIIKDEDFSSTVDLACGHGRNTEFLRRCAKSIDLVDVNQTCIDACQKRFGPEKDGCVFRYHLTTGNSLPVPSNSISLIYSWDAMVHFDKLVVRDYVHDVFRALKPGGTAFLHHSNYGTIAPDSSWTNNPGSRSDMTAELMRQYAQEAGLKIKFQRLSGTADGWGIDDLDCLSLLAKPA